MSTQHSQNSSAIADSSLVAVLRRWSRERPTETALTFVQADGVDRALTYGEIDAAARALAAELLRRKPACAGSRALLVYAPGPEFLLGFLGCLYAGVVAVPTYAPHPAQLKRSTERFLAIARDARPDFFLASSAYAKGVRLLMLALPRHWGAQLVDTDRLDLRGPDDWTPPDTAGEARVAFVQYTSGSTSDPKGVTVSHENLVHNLRAIQRLATAGTDAPIGVSWLPPYHDMGLIGGQLQPLYAGFPGYLFSPLEFLTRPILWLELISRHGATVSPFPNFALEYCLRKVTDEQRDRLDLSTWQVAINGAEPIRADTLARFSDRFAPCGFQAEAHKPVYGLAEATLMASCPYEVRPPRTEAVSQDALREGRVAAPANAEDTATFVSCGPALPGQTIRSVDPETHAPVAPDRIGEIWLSGPSIASGYWNKPDASAATFGARLAGSDEGPFLRTGDLGFLRDGELFVTGRLKDLIILRGKNVFPQDLEHVAEQSHPALRPGSSVAFAVPGDEGEAVVIVAEVRRDGVTDLDALARTVRDALRRGPGIDPTTIVLLPAGALPKTSSGKVRRFKARELYLRGKLKVEATWTRPEAPR